MSIFARITRLSLIAACGAAVHAADTYLVGVAIEPSTYDVKTNQLTIPSVRVGDTQYNYLVIRLDNVTAVSAESFSKAGGVGALPQVCTYGTDFTPEKLAKIKVGLTLEQVNQILGCQYIPALYRITDNDRKVVGTSARWTADGFRNLTVSFDVKGQFVKPDYWDGTIYR